MSIGSGTVVELYLNSVWTDISAYVRADPGIQIQFGVRGEAGTADPAQCDLVVNNFDGRFTPKNAEGPYYGYLKRNTPLRVTVSSVVRFIGDVSEFPARWEPSGGDVWVPLTASGPLRRLLRSATINGTLRTFIPTLAKSVGGSVTGYWPMEDGVGSTSFASGLSDGTPLTISGTPVFASIDGGDASAPLPKMDLVMASGNAPASPGSNEFTAGFLMTMPTAGTANNARLLQVSTSGTAATWVITYETGGGGALRLRAYNIAGTEILNQASFFNLDGYTRHIKLEVYTSGANVVWALTASGVGTMGNTLLANTVTSPTGVIVGNGNSITGDVGIGHVLVSDSDTTLFSFDFAAVLLAYAGESVEARMARVAALAGVNFALTDDGTVSQQLGPQPFATPLEIMREAEAADVGGILRDSISVLNQVVYITRRARYNTTSPTLTLNYTSGHLSPPLEPIDDDQLLANDVTVTRSGGSSARAVDTTGPLNSRTWPTGVGLYEKSVTLNVYNDTVLPAIANWLLTIGTIDETRFPVLTVDVGVNTSLATAVNNLRPGSLVSLTGLPKWAGGATTVYLHCLGWTERINSHRRVFELNCTPASPFDAVRLNDTTFGRLDSSTTTTNEALDTTETGVDYTGGSWITTATHPSEFPFNIIIGGEEMTVTSATGSTFTVTRSVNGVVKSHATGVPVHVARPLRVAL